MPSLPKTLRNIVSSDRERAFRDPQWLEDQLRLVHGDDSRVWVLVVAAEEEIARQITSGVPPGILTAQFETRRRLRRDAASWAAGVWGYALGMNSHKVIPPLESAPSLAFQEAERPEAWTRRKRVLAVAHEALSRAKEVLGAAKKEPAT